MDTMLVLTNFPDRERALLAARLLVESGLAACVQLLPEGTSIYSWQGKIEIAAEVPLLIKTTAERYLQVEASIRANHPYELPEIIAVPVQTGLPEYLQWLGAACSKQP